MDPILGEALNLMVIGLITVFLMLFFVILIGNILVRITNKFRDTPKSAKISRLRKNIEAKKLASIAAAVDVITGGEGAITDIRKKN